MMTVVKKFQFLLFYIIFALSTFYSFALEMQNNATSCTIVALLCLTAAIIMGGLGIWQKQVSACMVTGVMYIVAGR